MEILLWSLVIFAARVVDVSMGTIRVHMIIRGRKLLASLIGFFEVLIFILIVSRVISGGIEHWTYVLAYAAGFATGTLVGISLAERMRRGVFEVTIVPHGPWEIVEAAVRQAGYALTRQPGMGREGHVEILHIVCANKSLSHLLGVISKADAQAFVYTQELAGLQGGYVYGLKSKL